MTWLPGDDIWTAAELKRWKEWKPFKIKQWKPSKAAQPSAHVEMSQREFRSIEGYRFTFWALAPAAEPWKRRWHAAGRSDRTEYVWLVLDGTNGRGVHHALVDKETDTVYWYEPAAEHYQEFSEIA